MIQAAAPPVVSIGTLAPIAGAVATLIAATLAATIAFLGTILTKENKTSEFRQNWIDKVREDLAEFVGETEVFITYAIASAKGRLGDVADFVGANNERVQKATSAYYRIRLRLNAEEHKALLDALQNLFGLYSGRGELTAAWIDSAIERIIKEAQPVLKSEWRRVKRGEPSYFLTKYVALSVALVALVTIVVWTLRH